MENKAFKSYKEGLRNSFIGYALIPIVIISILAFLSILFVGKYTFEQRNIKANLYINREFERCISQYFEQVNKWATSEQVVRAIEIDALRPELYQNIYDFINSNSIRGNFYFLDKNGDIALSNTKNVPNYISDKTNRSWGLFQRFDTAPYNESILINRQVSVPNGYSIITIGKAIVDEGRVRGYIIIELLEGDIFQLVNNIQDAEVVVTDKFYNIAVTTNNKFSDQLTKLMQGFRNANGNINENNKKYYLKRSTIESCEFYVYTITELSFFQQFFMFGGIFLLVIFLILALEMISVAKKIAGKKTKSIDAIMEAIKSIQNGNLDTQLVINSKDEFMLIAESYNKMLVDIKNLIQLNKEEAKRSMIAEVKQLESQFNPHFLFNTLETIRILAKIDPAAVNSIIVKLSSLLRYSINNTKNLVTLEEDLLYTRNYLDILKYRFKEKFDYEIEIQQGAEECIIPRLIVQPIIENAVKYGFEGREHINIWVKARIFENQLIMVIYDNGKGINIDKLYEINRILSMKSNISESIGLFNVHRRIQLMYGENYGLNIISEELQGTTVRITIPVNRGEL